MSKPVSHSVDDLRVDRSAVSVGSIFDESDEKAYWLSKTPEERLNALEYMREIAYNYDDPNTRRLQSVLEVTAFPQR